MNRLTLGTVALFFFSAAHADRVFWTPTGYTLRPGEFRLDYSAMGSDQKEHGAFAVLGVVPFLEFSIRFDDRLAAAPEAGIDFQYSLIQPYPDLFPGISVGVLDAMNATERGTVLFLAATFQINLVEPWVFRERISLTLGGGTKLRGGFFSIHWPLHTNVAFLAEHDSISLTAGFEAEPIAGLALRVSFRDGHPVYGLQVRRIF